MIMMMMMILITNTSSAAFCQLKDVSSDGPTAAGDRCFAAAGPRLWNKLPAHLRQTDINFVQF